jgi:hypothetical protein
MITVDASYEIKEVEITRTRVSSRIVAAKWAASIGMSATLSITCGMDNSSVVA